MPLTSAEVIAHPGYGSVKWDLKPTKAGKCSVAAKRGGPIDIAYEIHGTGPIHIIWVMGLGAMKWYWQRQTYDFGHLQSSKYSCLVFDNRGMGESGKPLQRYTTSEMAKDSLELLDHVGWSEKERSIHVVGISMGGMIALEMAYLKPKMIASLSLVSTAAYLMNTVGYLENLRNRVAIVMPKSTEVLLAEVKTRVSSSWLEEADEAGVFPTNGDRFAAQELTKRADTTGFTRKGFMLQALAAATHNKSASQLAEIGDKVGRERIQILHGSSDNLITVPHAEVLFRGLSAGVGEEGEGGGKVVRKRIWDGRGHYLPMEEREAFREYVMELMERTAR